MTIDNSKLVLELFNYKKGLKLEQEDIDRVVSKHLDYFNCDETGKTLSQKDIVRSLKERLNNFNYDDSVKSLVESVDSAMSEDELFYDLEDLYRTLENSNQGMVYRHPMQVVLDIINENNDRQKQVKILNELKLYEWIPSVKNFMYKYTTNPLDRQNISSEGGKIEQVYSIVEKVQNDKESLFLTHIGDKWFALKEASIEPTTPSNHINDDNLLRKLVLLEKALSLGTIENDRITFSIDEDLDLSVAFKDGQLFLNGEKSDKGSSLQSIFDSPLVSFMRRDLYPVIKECVDNLDKFVELDIIKKISNVTQPFMECYAFNYKNNMYVYTMDKRYGNKFYEYDTATHLVNEMKTQLGFDLSDFFKDKFKGEFAVKKELEDREKHVMSKISDLNENIDKLKNSGLIEINEQIKAAYDSLLEQKDFQEKELNVIKNTISNDKHLK